MSEVVMCKKHGKPVDQTWKQHRNGGYLTRFGCVDCKKAEPAPYVERKPAKPPIKKISPASLSKRRAI